MFYYLFCGFQSTLPREERQSRIITILYGGNFNPRSHERSDLSSNPVRSCIFSYFNPRSHERSDTGEAVNFVTNSTFQSTLPREERQKPYIKYIKSIQFQSTLPREERQLCLLFCLSQAYFNPRSHERSDSIEPVYGCGYNDFNPRSHERSDGLIGGMK